MLSVCTDKCSLRYETKKIEFTNERGSYCVTQEEIPISYCRGACDSYDSSIVYTLDGDAILHDHECKCCSGTGELVTHTVDCFGEGPRDIKIMMFNQCGCNKCAGEGKYSISTNIYSSYSITLHNHYSSFTELVSDSSATAEGEDESTSVVMSSGSTLNSTDVIAFDSKLRQLVDLTPASAVNSLYNSNSSFHLSDSNSYIQMVMTDIERQVDSISFQAEGEGKIKLEMKDAADHYMINVSNCINQLYLTQYNIIYYHNLL